MLSDLLEDVLKIFVGNDINILNMNQIINNKNKLIMIGHIHRMNIVKSQEIMGFITEENEIKTDSDLMNEGDDMDYHQNFSLSSYLIEEYGLEKILYLNVADFSELTYEEVFGKTFEELQVEWINYLKDNIKDIKLIF